MLKHSFRIHPAAMLFPLMSADEFSGLKADIRANGQSEPITVWNNQVIDGRNRLRACDELEIAPIIQELDANTDPWQFVISRNLHRRHLTTSQRTMVAAKMATLKRGGDRKTEETKAQNCVPIDTAAKLLHVSPRSVDTAKQVIAHGSLDVVQAVERGELPVSLAARFVTEESNKREQTKIVKQGKAAVKAHITSIDFIEEPPPIPKKAAEPASNDLEKFKAFWNQCSELGKAAIRLWIEEAALNE